MRKRYPSGRRDLGRRRIDKTYVDRFNEFDILLHEIFCGALGIEVKEVTYVVGTGKGLTDR